MTIKVCYHLFFRNGDTTNVPLFTVSTCLRGLLLFFYLSLRFSKYEPIGQLEYAQMKTSIDKICTEEVEADGIYSGKQIKTNMPI